METEIQARVSGSRSSESLAPRTDHVLHASRSDLPLAGDKTNVAIALGEELGDIKRVSVTTEDFVGTEGNTEVLPDAPS
jgi:hypothetical protein